MLANIILCSDYESLSEQLSLTTLKIWLFFAVFDQGRHVLGCYHSQSRIFFVLYGLKWKKNTALDFFQIIKEMPEQQLEAQFCRTMGENLWAKKDMRGEKESSWGKRLAPDYNENRSFVSVSYYFEIWFVQHNRKT